MQSALELRSPSAGTGWSETWTFSGRDEQMLRDCLSALDPHATPGPEERWDSHRRAYSVVGDDRWQAAMLLFAIDPAWQAHGWSLPASRQAEAAWTADGARRLADMLPEALADLRAAIRQRFGATSTDLADP
jgi:hypothetical protein